MIMPVQVISIIVLGKVYCFQQVLNTTLRIIVDGETCGIPFIIIKSILNTEVRKTFRVFNYAKNKVVLMF